MSSAVAAAGWRNINGLLNGGSSGVTYVDGDIARNGVAAPW